MKPLVSISALGTVFLALGLLLAAGCRSASSAPEPNAGDQQESEPTVPDIARSAFQSSGTTAPTIVSLVPDQEAVNVERGTTVQVEYSDPVDPGGLDNAITLIIDDKPVAGTNVVDASNKKVTFHPAQALPASTEVIVIVNETVAGNFLVGGTSYVFTTE